MREYKIPDNALSSIEAKMAELLKLCQINRVPMFASIAVENKEDGLETEYERWVYSAKAYHIELNDDQIERHVLVANGFIPSPPRENIEMDMSDYLINDDTE